MRILVSVASKHGSTAELGDQLAARLTELGAEVVHLDPAQVQHVTGFDAVVLGSGVYAGRWLPAATGLIERLEQELRHVPVWLVSSGPLGDPPAPSETPAGVVPLIERVRAVEHRILAGRLRREDLSLPERAVVRAVRAPYGDFRDPAEVTALAEDVVAAVTAGVRAGQP